VEGLASTAIATVTASAGVLARARQFEARARQHEAAAESFRLQAERLRAALMPEPARGRKDAGVPVLR
jgi:hypothetical protein